MKIKYSPQNAETETIINIMNDNSINIDGIDYEFDIESVEWPDVMSQTNNRILYAHRDASGELYLTVLRQYVSNCADWDTGEYHDITR